MTSRDEYFRWAAQLFDPERIAEKPEALQGIRVLDLTVVRALPVEEVRRSWIEKAPLKRMVKPEEVAALAVFLCSELARTISGQCIAVTAGEPAV